MDAVFKFDDEQIDAILDRLVPLIAAPEDHELFRGVLRIKAEESTSAAFAAFCHTLLADSRETPKEVRHGVG